MVFWSNNKTLKLNKMNCELMLTYDTPAYMFNVHKNQPSRQTGSRNLMGPKTLPTIWYTYMKLVTKYQISAINSCWEKCDKKHLGRTDRRTDRGKTVYPHPLRWSGGIKRFFSFDLCTQENLSLSNKCDTYILPLFPNVTWYCRHWLHNAKF
jgi:hypothetical protein